MRETEPAKTRCTCQRPIKVEEPDGLGPRCLMCGLSLFVARDVSGYVSEVDRQFRFLPEAHQLTVVLRARA